VTASLLPGARLKSLADNSGLSTVAVVQSFRVGSANQAEIYASCWQTSPAWEASVPSSAEEGVGGGRSEKESEGQPPPGPLLI
jgi:hypothetical protein